MLPPHCPSPTCNAWSQVARDAQPQQWAKFKRESQDVQMIRAECNCGDFAELVCIPASSPSTIVDV